jgi:hypothetical protein
MVWSSILTREYFEEAVMKLRSVFLFAVLLFALSACNDALPTPSATSLVLMPTSIITSTPTPDLLSSMAVHTPSPTALDAVSTPRPTNTTSPQLPTATLLPTSTVPPTIPPTATASETAVPLPKVIASETAVPLSIEQFEIVHIEDINPGKRITFQWTAVGAEEVCLVSGTSRRLNPWWGQLPRAGTLTVEVDGTLYRDPKFTLQAYVGNDICLVPEAPPNLENRVTATVTVNWACDLDYFLAPAPQRCPLAPAITSAAAEQRFEHGRLIWLEEENIILAFFNDFNRFQQYPNVWQPGQQESDPSLIPPEGLYQPVRGFGQVWREQPDVRDQLGWALAPEQSYTAMYQMEHHEGSSSGAPIYLRTIDNEILWYSSVAPGSWGFGLP